MLSSNSFIDFTSPNSTEIVQEHINELKSMINRPSTIRDLLIELDNEIAEIKQFINEELESQNSTYKRIIRRQELKPKTQDLEVMFKKRAVLEQQFEIAKTERVEARAKLKQIITLVERFKEEQAKQRGDSNDV